MKPITGVCGQYEYDVQTMIEEAYEGINLMWEEHIQQCKNELHDECMTGEEESDILIGGWKKVKGLYQVNKRGYEYSAIYRENMYIQVVWSKTAIYCNKCSPCYPKQGDIGTDGSLLAYSLPVEFYTPEFIRDNIDRIRLHKRGEWKKVNKKEVEKWQRLKYL